MIDRRSLLAISAASTAAGIAAPAVAARVAADAIGAEPSVTAAIIDWAGGLRYEALPPEVVHAAKRYLLDSIGCALAGGETTKGRLARDAMIAFGGAPEATVFGTGARLSAANAAFANAELMNALDFDAIPHTPPVTLPALLAMAEKIGASGKQVIVATVIGHEITSRLSSASSQMQASLMEKGTTPEVFGISNEGIIAAASALSNLLGLDPVKSAHAIGLAGYYCPPQVSHDWETLRTKTNVKYTPVGWVSQGSVTATMLAAAGFTSNPAVFDGPAGFPLFYGWPAWKPEVATRGLGENWRMLSVDFKPHAACRFTHSQIDCMQRLVAKHAVNAAQIRRIVTRGVPFVAHPDPYNVKTQEDAQFSTPYVISIAAHGIRLDAKAQSAERLADPAIRATMRKVDWGIHEGSSAAKANDPRSYIARVEVEMMDGRRFVEEAMYPVGTSSVSPLSDDMLLAKFAHNAASSLTTAKAEAASERLWKLESASSFGEVAAQLQT